MTPVGEETDYRGGDRGGGGGAEMEEEGRQREAGGRGIGGRSLHKLVQELICTW